MFLSSARLVLIVSSLLAAVSNAVPQAKPAKHKAEDPAVYTVRVLLDQQSIGFSDGRLEKYSERLGDRVSTALLKIFKAKELEDPENIKTFLPIIRSAFLYPTLVPAQYRKPKVTLRLLDRLQRKVADGELKHQLSEVATFVTEQTRPKQGIPP